jgi:hypothetical protein
MEGEKKLEGSIDVDRAKAASILRRSGEPDLGRDAD